MYERMEVILLERGECAPVENARGSLLRSTFTPPHLHTYKRYFFFFCFCLAAMEISV